MAKKPSQLSDIGDPREFTPDHESLPDLVGQTIVIHRVSIEPSSFRNTNWAVNMDVELENGEMASIITSAKKFVLLAEKIQAAGPDVLPVAVKVLGKGNSVFPG